MKLSSHFTEYETTNEAYLQLPELAAWLFLKLVISEYPTLCSPNYQETRNLKSRYHSFLENFVSNVNTDKCQVNKLLSQLYLFMCICTRGHSQSTYALISQIFDLLSPLVRILTKK